MLGWTKGEEDTGKFVSSEKLLQIYLWVWQKIHKLKVYSKYISESEKKYINQESLLQVYFWIRKCMIKIVKSEVYAYGNFSTTLLYAFQKYVKSILEACFITKFITKFTFRVYTDVYLEYSSISARQKTSKNMHNLWRNGLMVRMQIYQTSSKP